MPAFSERSFQCVIEDERAQERPDAVRRIIFCSGKLYYDLVADRERRGEGAVGAALVRVEQLYPWPEDQVCATIERYRNAERVIWAQEEPANMGAWTFVRDRIQGALRPTQKLAYAGRRESASPAVGSMRIHREQQAAVVASAYLGLD